jgi:hypothetical protein
MTLHELDTVVLERDLPTHGLRRGDVGAVVHVHSSTAVEVEFVRASGHTQALVELATADLRLVNDDDLLAVRHVDSAARGAA